MTVDEAIKKYTEKFGGFPYFLFLGSPDEKIIEAVENALKTGKEIEPENPNADY